MRTSTHGYLPLPFWGWGVGLFRRIGSRKVPGHWKYDRYEGCLRLHVCWLLKAYFEVGWSEVWIYMQWILPTATPFLRIEVKAPLKCLPLLLVWHILSASHRLTMFLIIVT